MKNFIKQFLVVSKLFALTFVVLSFASAGFAQTTEVGIADEAASVTEFEVNGLKVLVKRRESAPTVAAGLFIRGGARNITAENAGVESFMLEVAKEASKNFPREVVRRELASTGGGIGASSANDYSVLSLASTRENFDKSWKIFTDLAMNPTFAAEDVERVRDGILTGLKDEETDADNFLQILQERVIYEKHPYSNSVRGTLETVRKLKSKDLRDYHKNIMKTSHLLLVVVGDIDADIMRKRVAETLGKLPRGDYKEKNFPTLDFTKPTLKVVERPLPTNYIQGIFEAPPLSSPDYPAMRVAIAILQANIFQEVRIKRQLSYAPNAEINSLSTNTANIYATAVDANQVASVMLDEINNLKVRRYNEAVIEQIAGNFLTLYYLEQQTNAAQAVELAKYELIGGGWENAFDFLNRVREVKPGDVQRVAKKYMRNLRFVVIGDPLAINEKIFLQK